MSWPNRCRKRYTSIDNLFSSSINFEYFRPKKIQKSLMGESYGKQDYFRRL